MNHYNCGTCKNGQCTAQLQGGVMDIPFHDFNYVTRLMGCASHSDFQNQREKVLDELSIFITKNMVSFDYEYYPLSVEVYELEKEIKRQRQSKEDEL